jgi:high-affinity Fe2+/Pb2+ permease
MTNLILLIGAGLFSKCVWAFQEYAFNKMLGTDVDDTGGDGPGSYDVRGNVWHLECCNPETDQAWGIFNAVFGWTNSATLGSVLSYVFYWVMVIVVLVHLKYKEVSSLSASLCPIHTIVNRVAPSFLDGSLQQAYVDGSQANNGQNNSR